MQALSSPAPAHMMHHAGGGGGGGSGGSSVAGAPPAPPLLSSRPGRGRDPLLPAALPVVDERAAVGGATAARAAVEAGLGAVVPDPGAARPPVAAVPTMRHVDPPAVRRTQGE